MNETPPKNFLLLPFGSAGDVHPFVGLGLALQNRGHDVEIATNGYFESLIRRCGLPFTELGTADEFLEVSQQPGLWSPLHGFATLFRFGIQRVMKRQMELVLDRCRSRPTVVIANGLGFGARIATEKIASQRLETDHRAPMVTIHLQPAFIFSDIRPPVLPGISSSRWQPTWLRRFQMRLGEKLLVDRVAGPATNVLRREVGLPPIRRLSRWWNSPDSMLGLFPNWFAPPAADWPSQLTLSEFPLWDESAVSGIEPELNRFLEDGAPPVVITPGTGNRHAKHFFTESVNACLQLQRRAILLTRFPEQLPDNLPPSARHFDYAPFGLILPRCAAAIHHGGVGTVSQCLRAGIPQIIMPLSYDQPDNLNRVEQLGVGGGMSPSRFVASSVARLLNKLLESERVRDHCRSTAARFVGIAPFETATRHLESL